MISDKTLVQGDSPYELEEVYDAHETGDLRSKIYGLIIGDVDGASGTASTFVYARYEVLNGEKNPFNLLGYTIYQDYYNPPFENGIMDNEYYELVGGVPGNCIGGCVVARSLSDAKFENGELVSSGVVINKDQLSYYLPERFKNESDMTYRVLSLCDLTPDSIPELRQVVRTVSGLTWQELESNDPDWESCETLYPDWFTVLYGSPGIVI